MALRYLIKYMRVKRENADPQRGNGESERKSSKRTTVLVQLRVFVHRHYYHS